MRARRALLALTSRDTLGETGRPTGAYLSEVVDAWRVFTAAGYDVEVVSVRGGRPPLEAVNPDDPGHRAFLDDPVMRARMADTPTARELDPARYAIVLVAGGHGAVWDLPGDAGLVELLGRVYDDGGVVAAVCHGPAALLDVVLSDGSPLVRGKRVAAFTNDEERAVGMTAIVPFLLADALRARGAEHDAVPPFLPHVVVDERLVTGQNPPSAAEVAEQAVAVAAASAAGAPPLLPAASR